MTDLGLIAEALASEIKGLNQQHPDHEISVHVSEMSSDWYCIRIWYADGYSPFSNDTTITVLEDLVKTDDSEYDLNDPDSIQAFIKEVGLWIQCRRNNKLTGS